MSDTGLRFLHVVSSLGPSAGGPSQSVTHLCEALKRLGASPEIATVRNPQEAPLVPEGVPVHAFPLRSPVRLRRSPGLASFLRREAGRFDLIHVHGLWEWPGVYARLTTASLGQPLVISPRGMLEPWSLRQNALVKRLAFALWEKKNLETAALLHATSEAEAGQFRSLGLGNPIALVPNGLNFPDPGISPIPFEDPTVLFLSRFHPKKGVDLLLKAWANLPSRGSWRLVLAGPDQDGYRSTLESLSASLGLTERVTFLGPQYGDDKWALLRKASLVVLPSHSENFGNIVPEALSQGRPVIATYGTPWEKLESLKCGWWVPTSMEGLRSALQVALSMPPEALAGMGERGRAWAGAAFSAEATAQKMLRHYQETLAMCARRS